ncbi:hypothetical protein C0J52_25838 [Blattella germanica]|nr:hypothetical protein C0J52_25838 [Blattella germanica]
MALEMNEPKRVLYMASNGKLVLTPLLAAVGPEAIEFGSVQHLIQKSSFLIKTSAQSANWGLRRVAKLSDDYHLFFLILLLQLYHIYIHHEF